MNCQNNVGKKYNHRFSLCDFFQGCPKAGKYYDREYLERV